MTISTGKLSIALGALATAHKMANLDNVKGKEIRETLARDLAEIKEAAELVKGIDLNNYGADIEGFTNCTRFTRSVKGQVSLVTLALFNLLEPIYTEQKAERTAKAITNAVNHFNTDKVESAKATAYAIQYNGNTIAVYSYNETLDVTEYATYIVRADGSVKHMAGHAQSGMQHGDMTASADNIQRITKGKAKAEPVAEEPAAEEVTAVDLDQLVDECTNHSTPATEAEPASPLADLTTQELKDGIAILGKSHGKDTASPYHLTAQTMIAEMQAELDSRTALSEQDAKIRRYLGSRHTVRYIARVCGCSHQHVKDIKETMQAEQARRHRTQ